MMNWKELLSEKRWSPEEAAGKRGLRSEIGRDYHRIIESASFRRLQDKTQVFPLDKSDFIRTRLTHSLEVSSIGRSLAQTIGESIIAGAMDPEFGPVEKDQLTEVLECAGLIHDIGNPPFGHFGEESIREWFQLHLKELHFNGRPVTEFLTQRQISDFYTFDGNAQDLRLVTKLHYPATRNGMNLTAATLSAIIKYPNSSVEADADSVDIQKRKTGYLFAETELFQWIQSETGTGRKRAPTAFILEAADDIAYATADIEDAFKKGFFSYNTLVRELSERGIQKKEIARLQNLYDFARLSRSVNSEEHAVRTWLTEVQDELIDAAAEAFLSDYSNLMNGERRKELLSGGASGKLLTALKTIAYDYAFTSESIYRTEIAANTIVTYLLDILVPAVLEYNTGSSRNLMTEKYLSLISDNYKQAFLSKTGSWNPEDTIYDRLLLATDSISSMTDSHARDLYAELKGFTSFFI